MSHLPLGSRLTELRSGFSVTHTWCQPGLEATPLPSLLPSLSLSPPLLAICVHVCVYLAFLGIEPRPCVCLAGGCHRAIAPGIFSLFFFNF